jgi:uncharacterized protein YbdZ (MbtH family)
MDDDATYEVLRNDEDQYSLWPAGHDIPVHASDPRRGQSQ